MRSLGAEIQFVEGGYELAEGTAIQYARDQKQTWVSAYNDGQVIAGQGTIGLELEVDLPQERGLTLVVPVGGGGLLAGIGAAVEHRFFRSRLVGVNAEASAFMHALYKRGDQAGVIDLPTLADGLSGAVETGSLTIPLVCKYADDIIIVTEEEIGQAIAFAWRKYHQKLEGSGAVGLAAVLAGKIDPPAIVVITGGNIQSEVHEELCRHYQVT
jgi:threonine dehydratase